MHTGGEKSTLGFDCRYVRRCCTHRYSAKPFAWLTFLAYSNRQAGRVGAARVPHLARPDQPVEGFERLFEGGAPVTRLPSELFERERGNGLTDAIEQAKTTGSSQRIWREDSASPYSRANSSRLRSAISLAIRRGLLSPLFHDSMSSLTTERISEESLSKESCGSAETSPKSVHQAQPTAPAFAMKSGITAMPRSSNLCSASSVTGTFAASTITLAVTRSQFSSVMA